MKEKREKECSKERKKEKMKKWLKAQNNRVIVVHIVPYFITKYRITH